MYRCHQSTVLPVQQIIVVDNSHQPLALASAHLTDAALLVWFHPENIGIAGGLELAIAWALQQNDDFLWTFEQDSVPAPAEAGELACRQSDPRLLSETWIFTPLTSYRSRGSGDLAQGASLREKADRASALSAFCS